MYNVVVIFSIWLLHRNYSEFRKILFIDNPQEFALMNIFFLFISTSDLLNVGRRDHIHLSDLKIDKGLPIANFMLCFSAKHLKDC